MEHNLPASNSRTATIPRPFVRASWLETHPEQTADTSNLPEDQFPHGAVATATIHFNTGPANESEETTSLREASGLDDKNLDPSFRHRSSPLGDDDYLPSIAPVVSTYF